MSCFLVLCIVFPLYERFKNFIPLLRSVVQSGPSSVFHRLDGLAVGILIFIRRSWSHKVVAGLWMLAGAESREALRIDLRGKAELVGQAALPFACDDAAL